MTNISVWKEKLVSVKHGQRLQQYRKIDLIKICPNLNLSAVSAEPSVTFKYRKSSDGCAAT